ncbi:hypothetical protein GCM10010402_16140 [Actinomadura luteofluorescens]|uniref:hypothetical protein n=1 Tax=Actinomadura luteofluorescens TaxID=46163 RepID=UPI0021646398|nr:hypothetical protein [Actinomadura glauciflava]MCR3739970.1 hypothetical protein [Actinomadura glauciflava]
MRPRARQIDSRVSGIVGAALGAFSQDHSGERGQIAGRNAERGRAGGHPWASMLAKPAAKNAANR